MPACLSVCLSVCRRLFAGWYDGEPCHRPIRIQLWYSGVRNPVLRSDAWLEVDQQPSRIARSLPRLWAARTEGVNDVVWSGPPR